MEPRHHRPQLCTARVRIHSLDLARIPVPLLRTLRVRSLTQHTQHRSALAFAHCSAPAVAGYNLQDTPAAGSAGAHTLVVVAVVPGSKNGIGLAGLVHLDWASDSVHYRYTHPALGDLVNGGRAAR